MILLRLVKKFIKLLNSDASPNQVAAGFALGSIIGLTPFMSLHNLAIWALIFLLKVNVSSAFLGVAVFSLIGLLTDPFTGKIGYVLLSDVEFLYPLWTAMYNMPIIPFTRFNNTIVMGSFVLSLILFVPVVFGMKYFIIYYRASLRQRLEKIKFFQVLKASKFYQWYIKFRD